MIPFHLAFPVRDLEATRAFYVDLLGCKVGRSSDTWLDLDFFGHQITAHLVASDGGQATSAGEPPSNLVDGKDVPVPHFGAILEWDTWHEVAGRLKTAGVAFLIEPHIRFPGEVGEQATLFMPDPSGNYIELKSFQDESRIFAPADSGPG